MAFWNLLPNFFWSGGNVVIITAKIAPILTVGVNRSVKNDPSSVLRVW